jgi:hypothetical protein
MIAYGPDNLPELSTVTPDLGGIARVMESYAADQKDSFAFEVSQLLSAVAHAVNEEELYDPEVLEGDCHRIAYAWLLGRLGSVLVDESDR